jgi:KaiC/GvpD/RAD55 family RecA-like ATPase
MVNFSAIPNEIMEALNKRYGFALFIKGSAGTGKTTLALEILKCAKNPIYISTRVSPEFLYEQFPWAKNFLPPTNIYDATQTYFPAMASAQTKRFQIFKYNDIPNFIEIVFEHFQQEEEPTIVIDSWDAVIGYKYPETLQEEKFSNLITELVRKTSVKLILVAENPAVSFLDFIVDGLIVNQDVRVENRRVRVIELRKLRGVRINQPYYTYTLEGGHFKTFPRYSFQFPSILLKPEPINDPHKDYVSTGITDLDGFLNGGYKKGSINLFEVAYGVGDGFLNYIIPLLVNYLNLGRGIVTILPEGYSTERFLQLLESFVDQSTLNNNIVTFVRYKTEGATQRGTIIHSLGEDISTSFKEMWESASLLKQGGIDKVLFYLSIDKLINMYEENEIIKLLSDHVAHLKAQKGDITVAYVRAGQNLIKKLAYISDIHAKICLLNKALAIYTIQPESEFQLVTNDTSKGYVTLNLTPLV